MKRKYIDIQWYFKLFNILYHRILRAIDAKILRKKLESILETTKKDFTIDQDKRLLSILKYAQKNCIFYSDKINFKNRTLAQTFREIPLIDKATIRKFKSNIISQEYNILEYYTMNTGGSTGEPFEFLASPHLDDIHQEFLFKKMGYKKGDVVFGLAGFQIRDDLISKNIFWQQRKSYGINSFFRLSSLYLNDNTYVHYINYLIEKKPRFFRGYPSFVNSLAEYIINNDIKIDFVDAIQLTAEQTFDYQLQNISKAFGAKIYQQYGHSEISIYAFTIDDSFKFYCSPFYGYTEILNEKEEHVKVGEIGEVVVTGFYNKIMPFIRYKTGDLAEYGGNKNGVTVLNKVIGRTQDYIYDLNGNKIAITAIVFGNHIKAFRNIIKWQIIQDKVGLINLYIVKGADYTHNDEDELRNTFSSFEINFSLVNNIPLTYRGKHKFVIQNIK